MQRGKEGVGEGGREMALFYLNINSFDGLDLSMQCKNIGFCLGVI